MSIVLYLLFCLFVFQVYTVLEKNITDTYKTPEKKEPKEILTCTEFTDKYLGKFNNSTFSCIYYDKVWNEMITLGNSGFDSTFYRNTISTYEVHLKLLISEANDNISKKHTEFDNYRRSVMSALKDKESSMKKSNTQNINKFTSITVLLDKIKDKDTKLMSNDSETLRQNAINISDLYLKYNTDDDIYKERVISQLTMIDTYLDRLMNESLLPGTKKYLENELNINQRYLDSIIDQDIIKDMEKTTCKQ